MSIKAMKLSLEALENSKPSDAGGMLDAEAMNELWHAHYTAINALRTAIQQAEQAHRRNHMTRDEIIRMAREAWALEFIPESDTPKLERFAALVAAHVRETEFKPDWNNYQQGLADAQRQPLTIDEVEAILSRWNYETHGDRARYIVRETEAAHGIKDNT